MRILKLPAKILYYVSDEFNKIFKNVFLCVSIQIAARISTGKSDMAIAHCWIWMPIVFYGQNTTLGVLPYATGRFDPHVLCYSSF